MSDLSKLSLKISYSSDSSNVITDFYNPCLERSCLYRRAVGYFTSHGLSIAAQGIVHLLQNGGKIQLIASPILTEEDVKAINEGYGKREDIIRDAMQLSLRDIESTLVKDRLNALAWLISSNSLDIKLAIRTGADGKIKRGIFHEKMGVFTDIHGNNVAFSGSPNETSGGLIENFEAIDVFWSWADSAGRVQNKIKRFDKFWDDNTPGLAIIDFTEATSDLLDKFKTSYIPYVDTIGYLQSGEKKKLYQSNENNRPHLPSDITLRDYQKNVLNNWFKNKGRGMLQLATGTGKTITALAAAITLFEKAGLELLIIVCPYRHLVTQWDAECRRFGLKPILAFSSSKKWTPIVDRLFAYGRDDDQSFPVIITTIATFSGQIFQVKLDRVPERTFIIGDEAHNLGAKKVCKGLPRNVPWRMGLSATPERWFDEIGTKGLFDYFGKIVEPKVTLKEALQWGVLTPYYYYPILVELSEDEYVEYLELTEKIGKIFAMGGDIEDEDSPLQALLIKRSRLIANTRNKIVELDKLARSWVDPSHFLVYCGDGSVNTFDEETNIDEENQRHIDQVTHLLGNQLGIKVAQYTAETSLEQREQLKRQLAEGEMQGIIAIRCLDEGVDIPSIKTAVILASSSNPRQFVQRRGRILRLSDGKEFSTIYDMVVIPPPDSEIMDIDRKLVKKELARFIEFADLAQNSAEARSRLLEVQKKYSLLDM